MLYNKHLHPHPKAVRVEDCVFFAFMKNCVVCTDPVHLRLCRKFGAMPESKTHNRNFVFCKLQLVILKTSLCGTSAAQYTMYYHKAPPSLSRENYLCCFWQLTQVLFFIMDIGEAR